MQVTDGYIDILHVPCALVKVLNVKRDKLPYRAEQANMKRSSLISHLYDL